MKKEIKPGAICAHVLCSELASVMHHRGRISMGMCEKHFKQATAVKLESVEPATTGSKEGDRMVNLAVDMALLRLKPIIRDIMREEIKKHLELEQEAG